jgi:hypothetical protein
MMPKSYVLVFVAFHGGRIRRLALKSEDSFVFRIPFLCDVTDVAHWKRRWLLEHQLTLSPRTRTLTVQSRTKYNLLGG